MSDHEFEKQVQRKMDELKIRPSDTVWAKVQTGIRQNKRRRFTFWLPVFFIFLAMSGYMFFSRNQPSALPVAQSKPAPPANKISSTDNNIIHSENNSTQQVNPVQPAGNTPLHNESSAIQQSNPVQPANNTMSPGENNPNRHRGNARLHSHNGTSSSNINDAAFITPSGNNKQTYSTRKKQPPFHQPPAGHAHATPIKTGRTGSHLHVVHANDDAAERHSKNYLKNKPAVAGYSTVMENEEQENVPGTTMPGIVMHEYNVITTGKAAGNLITKPVAGLLTSEKQKNTTAIPALSIQKQHGPKWQWGIQVNAGFSRISQSSLIALNGLLGSEDKNRAEDLARSLSPSSSLATANFISVAPPVEKKAAPIQPDLAYSAGLFVQRPLSKRLRLTIGLQYAYMSVHTTIGRLVEQPTNVNYGAALQRVVSSYYTAAETKDALQSQMNVNYTPYVDSSVSQQYTYRFHAIELPVTINWQINKGRRLPPLVLDGGCSVSRIWSIDGLHFDGIKGIYYNNNGLFNKTQLNAILGLNIGLFQQSKLPVWIGPSLRYALTRLVEKDVSKGQFLWSTGINLRIQLNRF